MTYSFIVSLFTKYELNIKYFESILQQNFANSNKK